MKKRIVNCMFLLIALSAAVFSIITPFLLSAGVLFTALGIAAACLTLYLFPARMLANRIVKPINEYDIESEQPDLYEELAPFVRTIGRQRERIDNQFSDMADSEKTFRAIMENTKEGVLLLDENGLIIFANRGATELLHGSRGVYEGRNILELTRDFGLLEGVKKTLSGEGSDITLSIGGKAVQLYLSPVHAEEGVSGIIILLRDVTEKINAEKIRREFSANVSHELKTPLTTILGLSEMMAEDMVKADDINRFSSSIKNEAERLIVLIDDIIKLSELDEGASGGLEEADVLEVAADVLKRLKPVADEKNVALSALGRHTTLSVNPGLIADMLYNLVDNGIKYNKPGGKVEITVGAEGGKTVIEVADTGIGIGKEHLERIFERFYRVDKSRSKKTGGTGLGLSIVKHIAEYHNGSVRIESMENTGTKVKVVI